MVAWLGDKLHVAEDGVNRAADDFHAEGFEFFYAVGEGDDFSGADKGEVEWVEEEDNVPVEGRGEGGMSGRRRKDGGEELGRGSGGQFGRELSL